MADQGRSPAVAKKVGSILQRPRLRRCIAIGALAHALSVIRLKGKLLLFVTAECSRVVIRIAGGPHAFRNLIAHDAAYQKSKVGGTCFLFTTLFGSYNLPSAGIGMIRATGAAATARAVVIPFGQRAPSTMLGAHLHAFVLLYSSRLLIVLYSPNGVRVQTNTKTGGGRHPERYERVQTEHTRMQRSTNGIQKPQVTSRAVQTEYKRGTKEYKRIQTEYKTKLETTSLTSQTSTNGIQTTTTELSKLEGHYILGTTN